MAFTRIGALEYLSRAHERGRLAHAYLISGPPGSGKRGLASDLSNLVTGAKSADVFASAPPGVYLAEPESKSRRIVIGQVRDLEHALQMRSANGHRKVAIVADADRLQPQAANAFLKTLEEPPKESLLLLLSSMPEVLPDTILSRCIAVPLAAEEKAELSTEENELVELLGSVASAAAQGVQHAYRLARGFHSLLAQMRATIQEENAAALKRDETRYKNTTDGAWLDDREDYYKALTESQYVRQRSRLVEVRCSSREHGRGPARVSFREEANGNPGEETDDRRDSPPHSTPGRNARSPGPKHPGSARHRGRILEHLHLLI